MRSRVASGVVVAALASAAAVFAATPPLAVTGRATNVTSTGAVIQARIDPRGATDTNVIFDWGPTRSYGSVAGGFFGFSTKPRTVRAVLSDLAPGTLYHYRITATSGGGSARGRDATFKTRGTPAVNATPVTGSVLVRRPGSTTFVALDAAQRLRAGTVVDTRQGTIQICPPNGAQSPKRCSSFHDGVFRLGQAAGAISTLTLVGGSFGPCRPVGAHAAGATLPSTSIRHLWGEGHGRFRTVGRFSSATVRGTTWLTDDRCDGTLTRVTRGSVVVRDFARRKAVVVRGGHRYLARA
ncbi:MAG: hypothetical protein QOH13_2508 [Thermoleophilaceae bacterium]|nr:hypothetical protein [Thermoleophilaceae bacterium]